MLRDIMTCWGKDFNFYFRSKMVYVLLLVYLAMSVGFTFYVSNFYSETTINLYQFFKYQPAIWALIVPALTMRLWADEYRHNTLEILLVQPISNAAIVIGKFLAVWAICGLMIVVNFGVWFVVGLIVPLDNFWVLINYSVTFLAVGSLCAVSAATAAFCYNILGAFLVSLAICMVITMADFSSWLSRFSDENSWQWLQFVKAFDFAKQFDNMIMGRIDAAEVVYFVLLMFAGVGISMVATEYKRN